MILDCLLILLMALLGGVALGRHQAGADSAIYPAVILGAYLSLSVWVVFGALLRSI